MTHGEGTVDPRLVHSQCPYCRRANCGESDDEQEAVGQREVFGPEVVPWIEQAVREPP